MSAQEGQHRPRADKDKFTRAAQPGRDEETEDGSQKSPHFDKPEHRSIAADHIQAGIPGSGINGNPQGNNERYNRDNQNDIALLLRLKAHGVYARGKKRKKAKVAAKQRYPRCRQQIQRRNLIDMAQGKEQPHRLRGKRGGKKGHKKDFRRLGFFKKVINEDD